MRGPCFAGTRSSEGITDTTFTSLRCRAADLHPQRHKLTAERDNGDMMLPVMPPVAPMLAKAVSEISVGASYEPKRDGFSRT